MTLNTGWHTLVGHRIVPLPRRYGTDSVRHGQHVTGGLVLRPLVGGVAKSAKLSVQWSFVWLAKAGRACRVCRFV